MSHQEKTYWDERAQNLIPIKMSAFILSHRCLIITEDGRSY